MRTERLVVAFQCKALGESDTRSFEGYGSVFGVLDSYADVVAPGAFKRSLREHKAAKRMPALLWQHDPSAPIGVYEDMHEDEHGLAVRGRLSDTQLGREAYTLLKDGALSGLSIGFVTRKSTVDEESGVRTLTDVQLWETSLVTFPANDAARITSVKGAELHAITDAVIALLGGGLTERDAERTLRDAGFSRDQAKHIIAKGYRDGRREAMPSTEACDELLALISQRAALATGVRGHGNHGRQEGARRE